ncbi:MAG: hypothetical protein H6R25_3091 [Proteobacteria bacterium]|nr:hypothetical protein [Pseudomonadota bacterium]
MPVICAGQVVGLPGWLHLAILPAATPCNLSSGILLLDSTQCAEPYRCEQLIEGSALYPLTDAVCLMSNQKGGMFPPQNPFFKAIYNFLINKFFYIAAKKGLKR